MNWSVIVIVHKTYLRMCNVASIFSYGSSYIHKNTTTYTHTHAYKVFIIDSISRTLLLLIKFLLYIYLYLPHVPYPTQVSQTSGENLTDLMRETDDIAERRKECLGRKELLEEAMTIVKEVQDFRKDA